MALGSVLLGVGKASEWPILCQDQGLIQFKPACLRQGNKTAVSERHRQAAARDPVIRFARVASDQHDALLSLASEGVSVVARLPCGFTRLLFPP